jgi:hypothetical protein
MNTVFIRCDTYLQDDKKVLNLSSSENLTSLTTHCTKTVDADLMADWNSQNAALPAVM